MDLRQRALFERYASHARDAPPEVAWACAVAALDSSLVTGVLIAFGAGRETAIALAMARERDPTPLVEAGFEGEVQQALAIVERVAELAGPRTPTAGESALIERMRNAPARRPDPANALPWGQRSEPLGHPVHGTLRDFYLQNPLDRHIRHARPRLTDPALASLVDAWLAAIDENYEALAAGADPGHGDVATDALMLEGPGAPHELYSPAQASARDGELRIATTLLRLSDGVSPQPDGIAAKAGETWRIRGHVLEDGTVMPCCGTFRLAG